MRVVLKNSKNNNSLIINNITTLPLERYGEMTDGRKLLKICFEVTDRLNSIRKIIDAVPDGLDTVEVYALEKNSNNEYAEVLKAKYTDYHNLFDVNLTWDTGYEIQQEDEEAETSIKHIGAIYLI